MSVHPGKPQDLDNFALVFVEQGTVKRGVSFPEARSLGAAYGTKHLVMDEVGVVWFDSECAGCHTSGMYPSHSGSLGCESGSLRSGGKRAHCACDACF